MASSDGFPTADVKRELNPGKDFQVDPISADVATSKDIKEQAEAAKRLQERQKKDAALQNFKTAIIVSGIVVAVAGAAFAITKKLREK